MSQTTPCEYQQILEGIPSKPFVWVARDSTSGRGFRLHQSPAHHAQMLNEAGHTVWDTPLEALRAYQESQ